MATEKSIVSILVANHNNACFIEQTLDSIMAQSYPYIEVIVVDDASTDNSIEVIENYIRSHPKGSITLYKNYVSHGCGRVKRKCVDIARGDYFAFLDPDDAIVPDAVEKLVSIHESGSCYSIVYSTQFLCDEKLQVQSKAIWPGEIPLGQSNLTSKKGHVSAFALCKKSCYDQTAGINPEYVVAEDQDLYFKMEEIAPVFFLNEPLYFYRKHDHNMSYSDEKEVRNKYWLMKCVEAAYHRRKETHHKVPNITKKDLVAYRLDYYIEVAVTNKMTNKSYVMDLIKIIVLSPFSVRKSFRGIRRILSTKKYQYEFLP